MFRLTTLGRTYYEPFVNGGGEGDPVWDNWVSTNLSTCHQKSLWHIFRHFYNNCTCTTTPGWMPKVCYIGMIFHAHSLPPVVPNLDLEIINTYVQEHVEELMDELGDRGFIEYATEAFTFAKCLEWNVDPNTFAALPIPEAVPPGQP